MTNLKNQTIVLNANDETNATDEFSKLVGNPNIKIISATKIQYVDDNHYSIYVLYKQGI